MKLKDFSSMGVKLKYHWLESFFNPWWHDVLFSTWVINRGIRCEKKLFQDIAKWDFYYYNRPINLFVSSYYKHARDRVFVFCILYSCIMILILYWLSYNIYARQNFYQEFIKENWNIGYKVKRTFSRIKISK